MSAGTLEKPACFNPWIEQWNQRLSDGDIRIGSYHFREYDTFRFWKKVSLEPNGCMYWNGTVGWHGYGILKVGKRHARVQRLAFAMAFGWLSEELCVLHKCDNRRCVNPAHLFSGTRADNNRDMAEKDRCRNQTGSKITFLEVEDIRSMIASGKTQKEAAEKYCIHSASVSRIARGVQRVIGFASPQLTIRQKSSTHKGVTWHKAARKWMAHISVNRKLVYLGLFEHENEAAEVAIKAKKELSTP